MLFMKYERGHIFGFIILLCYDGKCGICNEKDL